MKETLYYGIGGGKNDDPRMNQHFSHIAEIIKERAGSETPTIAILPTAHHNGLHPDLTYRNYIKNLFQEHFSLKVIEILIGDVIDGEKNTPIQDIANILASSHGLYVMNGDTRYLMEKLSENNLTETFINAFNNGLFFSGSSAGCIWVGEYCMSDSEAYDDPNSWEYISVKGLGLLKGIVMNAHDDQGVRKGEKSGAKRNEIFKKMLKDEFPNMKELAIPEYTGVEIKDGEIVKTHIGI